MERQPCVYMLASRKHGTLYIGVTSNLIQRIHQHCTGTFGGFTKDYEIHRLVWFEMHETMETAIAREKQLKNWRREWKCNLIERENPGWDDLSNGLGFDPA